MSGKVKRTHLWARPIFIKTHKKHITRIIRIIIRRNYENERQSRVFVDACVRLYVSELEFMLEML